jgi:hypothetical protein
MIGKQIRVIFLLAIGLTACNSENTKDDKSNTGSGVEQQKNTRSENETALSDESESDEESDPENVFRGYDAGKKILKNWNQAISEHQLSDLENLYADEVFYYAKKMTKQAILDQKSDWLKKHMSYQQKLGYSAVYYDDRDTLGVEFVAQFTKICIENKKKTEVESYLYFRKFGSDWKIVQETDAITEVNLARKKPVVNLPEGKYKYYVGQWSDTRDIPQFAHEMVPYNSSLDFTIGEEGISGVYNEYSGTARSRAYYLVKSGKVENGILELKVIYSPFANPAPEDFDGGEETKTWRFKILENQQLLCLSSENLTLYSKTLTQVE